ncbi:unnamed protein product, partial [Rotaria socialis]
INQQEFQAVIGKDFKLCEKTAQFDAKKYAEFLHSEQQPQAAAKSAPATTAECAKGEKKKAKEEKPAKEKKPAKKEEEEEIPDD